MKHRPLALISALSVAALALTGCGDRPEPTGAALIDHMVERGILKSDTYVVVQEATIIADDGRVSVMISGNPGVAEGAYTVDVRGTLHRK